MGNKQQTAVQWLAENTEAIHTKYSLGLIKEVEYYQSLAELVVQAKQMEKEQAHKYAEFAIRCDREELPILEFDGYINLENDKSE